MPSCLQQNVDNEFVISIFFFFLSFLFFSLRFKVLILGSSFFFINVIPLCLRPRPFISREISIGYFDLGVRCGQLLLDNVFDFLFFTAYIESFFLVSSILPLFSLILSGSTRRRGCFTLVHRCFDRFFVLSYQFWQVIGDRYIKPVYRAAPEVRAGWTQRLKIVKIIQTEEVLVDVGVGQIVAGYICQGA